MCLAVPAKIIDRQDMMATVEVSGVIRKVSMMLLPDAKVGDYVLVHAGFAIQTVDEEEARRTLELLEELGREL
jgi:hydrogenase expression/formation protein HypC